jgi:hypothetical protein
VLSVVIGNESQWQDKLVTGLEAGLDEDAA